MKLAVTTAILVLATGFHFFGPSIRFEEIGSIDSPSDALALFQGPPDDTTVALEARCGGMQEAMRRTCKEALSVRFASEQTSPASLILLHCTRVESVWDAPLPEPPALCVQRFGGWVTP